MKKDAKIILKKEIILNNDLSNNAILTYIGLSICLKKGMSYVYADKNLLYYYLSGKPTTIPRRFEENIKKGMKELLDKNIITCKNKINNIYYINADSIITNKDDNYIIIHLSEIQKIISCDYQGKISLLRYYTGLLSTLILKNNVSDIRDSERYNNILGMLSQEYVADLLGISIHTVVDYTKILEELELIYVSRCSFKFKDKSGKVKRHNNIYGRYENKELIDEFANIRYSMYDDLHKVQNANNINNARSLTQKYNRMLKGTKYDKVTVAAIYEYINNYNKKYPNKSKDISIFEGYGYKI